MTLEPEVASASVAPGANIRLKLRLVNVSDHTVSVRTQLPYGGELIVTTDKGVKIAPPEGSAVTLRDPACARMSYSHMEVQRGVVVALLPGGVIEDLVEWQASRMAWPPPKKDGTCYPKTILPVAKGPLPAGKYSVVATPRIWSEPSWLEPNIATDVMVK